MESNEKPIDIRLVFVGLGAAEQAPRVAAYQLDNAGQPLRKLGSSDGGVLRLEVAGSKVVAIGPDVDDFRTLPRESLASYRVAQSLEQWRQQGLILPRDIWDRFHFHFVCVSGTVRKCRPWYWDVLSDVVLAPALQLAQIARIKPVTAELQTHLLFPHSCQPVCDGVVEVYARVCCCHHVHIPTLIDRLRDILDVLPIPIPDPIPDPRPGPGPDPAPFSAQRLRSKVRSIQQQKSAPDLAALPPDTLHGDYLALRTLAPEAARQYVDARPYLLPLICHCSIHKVGQTALQPGGQFDLCWLQPRRHRHCVTTFAYKVRQLINGVLTVVYDGVAAHQYFSAGQPSAIRIYNPLARTCADGPGDPPPNDGQPFVMLEHVGSYGSFHFNFPQQTGVSQVAPLDADDGTYSTAYAPDCPWGSALGLRLWFSPELEPIARYYRLRVIAVNDAGSPVGAPVVLNDTVTWDKLQDIPGDVIRVPETLGPISVASENDLFKIPYWSSPGHRYLSGQFHQVWNTARSVFPDGRYLLLIEVFDAAGNRLKPSGAAGPGLAAPFQFRRWVSTFDTDPVPFADAAHVFWLDNTPVGGDIVDLRRNGVINTAECQFLSGPGSTTFAIGMRAFHLHGVEHAGNGDDNSFMWHYAINWQRGLNGSTGTLGPAPSGGNNHTDVGETGGAVTSGSESFQTLLTKPVVLPDGTPGTTVLPRCTFSVSLHVYAKHFTGSGRIDAYDYHETASFALEITS